MFKMGCSMARKILAIDGKGGPSSAPDSDGPKRPRDRQHLASVSEPAPHTPARADGKPARTSGDALNDFSKLEEDPRMPLNVRQIFKITKSWKAIARTMSKTGTAMFLNLFEQNQDLFYLFDRFQHLKGKDLHESMELREHAATVMSTLDQSINSLSDYDNFVTYLHSIGELHRKVPGFKREHFWKIEQPFMKAVKQTLDERCNETIEAIYTIAIKLIIETIADGYGDDQPDEPEAVGAGDSNKPAGSGGHSGGGSRAAKEPAGREPPRPVNGEARTGSAPAKTAPSPGRGAGQVSARAGGPAASESGLRRPAANCGVAREMNQEQLAEISTPRAPAEGRAMARRRGQQSGRAEGAWPPSPAERRALSPDAPRALAKGAPGAEPLIVAGGSEQRDGARDLAGAGDGDGDGDGEEAVGEAREEQSKVTEDEAKEAEEEEEEGDEEAMEEATTMISVSDCADSESNVDAPVESQSTLFVLRELLTLLARSYEKGVAKNKGAELATTRPPRVTAGEAGALVRMEPENSGAPIGGSGNHSDSAGDARSSLGEPGDSIETVNCKQGYTSCLNRQVQQQRPLHASGKARCALANKAKQAHNKGGQVPESDNNQYNNKTGATAHVDDSIGQAHSGERAYARCSDEIIISSAHIGARRSPIGPADGGDVGRQMAGEPNTCAGRGSCAKREEPGQHPALERQVSGADLGQPDRLGAPIAPVGAPNTQHHCPGARTIAKFTISPSPDARNTIVNELQTIELNHKHHHCQCLGQQCSPSESSGKEHVNDGANFNDTKKTKPPTRASNGGGRSISQIKGNDEMDARQPRDGRNKKATANGLGLADTMSLWRRIKRSSSSLLAKRPKKAMDYRQHPTTAAATESTIRRYQTSRDVEAPTSECNRIPNDRRAAKRLRLTSDLGDLTELIKLLMLTVASRSSSSRGSAAKGQSSE